MKIVVLDAYTVSKDDLSWDFFERYGKVTVYQRTPADLIADRMKDADVVFTSKCNLDEEIIDSCPSLKFIGALATGYDNIDITAAKRRGIVVCNVPSYSSQSVAQHTFALILEITNNVGKYGDMVNHGKWSKSEDFCFYDKPIIQLSGRSLGIIGYGNIGKEVAKIATAFGMTVNVFSKDPSSAVTSDILTIHCPLTEENKGFINSDFLWKMKTGSILINTARGGLINESDLVEALQSGKLAAAGLDVISNEPPARDHIFYNVPNLYLTPHIAWSTFEARKEICRVSENNLSSFLNGDTLNRIV